MKTLQFKTNIHCGGCLKAVTPFLEAEKTIKEWSVDTDNPNKVLTVKGDEATTEKVVSIVKEVGFEIEVLA